MTYNFKKPVRKSGFYYIPMDPLEFKIGETTVELAQIIAGRGLLLSLYVPENSKVRQSIDQLDLAIINEVQTHNEEWFSRTLTIDKIRQYFQPTITMNSLSVLTQISDLPTDLSYESLYGKTVSCVLVATGLKIYPKNFTIRYTLKKIHTINDYSEHIMDEIEPTDEDYADIVTKMNVRLTEVKRKVDREVADVQSKLSCLSDYSGQLGELLTDKGTRTDEWLEKSDKTLAKLTTGQLYLD